MPVAHPLLSLENITVRYLNQTLFTNLNFQVNQGEHWALVGESGSGKSGLLQTIAGSYNVVNGSIHHHYYQEYLRQNPEHDAFFTYRNLLAEVSQKHNFKNLSNTTDFYYQQRYNSFDSEDAPTVASFLSAATISVLGTTTPFWNYDKTIHTFDLDDLLDKQLIKLSNGETKRLLIAAALLKNPRLLLLDNPFTGLDVHTRIKLNRIISDIAGSDITVIMATSPTEIPDAVTHVAMLKQREIVCMLPKSDFEPAQVKISAVASPDEEELQALLSLNAPARFDTIVGMENVSIRYGDKQVLDKVNWRIRQGERWALLGHNGAGKTTLLSIINGDNPQSYANKIVLFDRKKGSGESIWDIKKRIGFVSPELYQYFPYGSTCLEAVESGFYDTLGLFRQSEPENAGIALRWMKLLGIEQEATEQPLRNVSASTQRQCLLARALVKNPPLLILDEPCQGLDQHQQQHFKQLLDAICAYSPTTLVYVTHYQDEIPACVTKVLRLEGGLVVSEEQAVDA